MKKILLWVLSLLFSLPSFAIIGPITGSSSVCRGATTTLSDTSAGGRWSSLSPAVATVGSATGVVTGIGTGITTITYTTSSGFTTKTFTVTPTPAAITGTATMCVGATTTLSDVNSGGVWSSANPSVATISSGGVVTGITTGTANISYTYSSGCAAATTVTVNPGPSAISGGSSVCIGSSITFTDADPGGRWSNSNTNATIGSATGILTGVAAGSTAVTYTLPSGCRTTTAVTVTYGPSTIVGTTPLCSGATNTYFDGTTGGTWSSSNASVATIGSSSAVVTAVSAGTAIITYTAASTCFITKTISVLASPAPITGTLSVCIGRTTTLSDATPGGTWSTGTTYVSIGSATGIVTGLISGTPVVTYSTGTSCVRTASVTVISNPAAISGTATYTAGSTGTLTCSTAGGAWSSSDATVATIGSTGVVNALSAGTAVISYTMASGCYAIKTITVNAAASISGVSTLCRGTTSAFTGSPSAGTWSSSNTSIVTIGSSTGIATGVAAGAATITYSAGSSYAVTTVSVITAPPPITGYRSTCQRDTIQFADATPGGVWSLDDTLSPIDSITGAYVPTATSGIMTVTYTLPSGCYTTKDFLVVDYTPTLFGPTAICGGTTALDSAGDSLHYDPLYGRWSSSDATIATIDSTSGLITPISAGRATITYTIGAHCTFTHGLHVVDSLPPISDHMFYPLPTTLVWCVGDGAPIISVPDEFGAWTSSDPGVADIFYGGDYFEYMVARSVGSSIITYSLPGTSCMITDTIIVRATPSIGGPSVICSTDTITLTDTSFGGFVSGFWLSSDTLVATIGYTTGFLSGISAGTTTIWYGTYCGSATTTVTVTPVDSCTGPRFGNGGSGNQQPDENVTVYPNPTATTTFTLKVPVGGAFTLYTVDGREVGSYEVSAGANSILMSDGLAAGIYMGRYKLKDGRTGNVKVVYQPQ